MDILVLILSFNHMELTQKCLNSVKKKFSDKQIVLIHNGSSNFIVQKLKEYYQHIYHVEMSENKGYAGGMNYGLRYVFENFSHRWYLVLTNDTELMEFNEEVLFQSGDVVAPQIFFRSLSKLDSWGGWYDALRGKLYHYKNTLDLDDVYDRENFYIPGTAFLLRRDVLKGNLFFEESLFTFWEDVYFSYRAKKMGFFLSRTSSVKVKHGGGKTTKKDAMYTSYYYQRNRLIVSPRLNTSFWLKKISVFYIVKEILQQCLKKILQKDFARGKNLILALRHGLNTKYDEL